MQYYQVEGRIKKGIDIGKSDEELFKVDPCDGLTFTSPCSAVDEASALRNVTEIFGKASGVGVENIAVRIVI
jgi:hypothetical protein